MPDLTDFNLTDFLVWAVSTAGLVFYATWLSKFLKKLRYPDSDEYDDYSPYMQKWSDSIVMLTSIQMMNVSLALYVVPVVIVYVIVNFVPNEWLALLQPHVAFIISVLLVYAGQQWAYKRPVE